MEIRENFLPFALPYQEEDEVAGVVDSIKSNWWTKGPKTAEFERRFAEYVGAKYALALNSCTAALHISLVAIGLQPGDEVITTPMTFAASANIIIHAGGTPVFADIDEATGLIDPKEIERHITPKTVGIIPVHYAGQSCDMDAINAIAKQHNLFVLEDAAHAVATTYNGSLIGGSGNPTAFSFYATKNLATGEGGMLTSNDQAFMEKARVYSLHGMSQNAWNRYGKGGSFKYDILFPGFKYNMTDIAAALGLAQMDKLQKMQDMRHKVVQQYNEQLADVKGITALKVMNYGQHADHLYIIKVGKGISIDRDEFATILKDQYNIGISVHYIPVHMHPYYTDTFGYKAGDYPKAEHFYSQIISLPLYPQLSKDDVTYVTNAVRTIAEQYAT